jgi:aminopeptidase YwaD
MDTYHYDFMAAARRALARTKDLIDRFGGRLAGSDACQKTALALKEAFERACGNATLEPFETHPRAFTGFYQIDIGLYVVGLALLFFKQPLAAGLVLLFMATAAGLQFGWYVEFYDRLYALATCYNVTAVLEPRGLAKRQLILSGHHDSANELKFLKKNQKLYGLKIVVPDFFRLLALTFAWVWVGWRGITGVDPYFGPWVLALLIPGTYFVFTKFFLFEPWAVPGAGDNLIASAMLVELAEMMVDRDQPGQSVLENTRLIFASFDAEESGLRGSRAWIKAHREELSRLPTYALNIDSVFSAADIQFLISDLNSHIALDRPLAELASSIARERLACAGSVKLASGPASGGLPARLIPMRFGGGATDATELAKAGVKATTMIAMPAGIVRDGLAYHTMRDTVEAVEPAAVEGCLMIAEGLAREIDRR